jgi:hypothetical protein
MVGRGAPLVTALLSLALAGCVDTNHAVKADPYLENVPMWIQIHLLNNGTTPAVAQFTLHDATLNEYVMNETRTLAPHAKTMRETSAPRNHSLEIRVVDASTGLGVANLVNPFRCAGTLVWNVEMAGGGAEPRPTGLHCDGG